MKLSPAIETMTLDLDGLRVAAIRQRDIRATAQPRMLCLHGWLDNAASFVPMMPHLPAFDLVAIDMMGHGYSDHVPSNLLTSYSLFDYARIAHSVTTALGWESCHLVGHSLGACVAPMLAVAAPESIESLIMIEAAGPLSEEPDTLPARLARALQDRVSPQRFTSRSFKTKDEAIDARLAAARMERSSARLIIDRQVTQGDDGGWRWRFDPALRYSSPIYQTNVQACAILQAVTCRSLSILADEGFLTDQAHTNARLDCLGENTRVQLPGNHHVHMDTPEPVAAAINAFLGTAPAL